MQWDKYREENILLRAVADKYEVTTIMFNELYPELAVTVGAYEKLVEMVDTDSTLTVFGEQVKTVNKHRTQEINHQNNLVKAKIVRFPLNWQDELCGEYKIHFLFISLFGKRTYVGRWFHPPHTDRVRETPPI